LAAVDSNLGEAGLNMRGKMRKEKSEKGTSIYTYTPMSHGVESWKGVYRWSCASITQNDKLC